MPSRYLDERRLPFAMCSPDTHRPGPVRLCGLAAARTTTTARRPAPSQAAYDKTFAFQTCGRLNHSSRVLVHRAPAPSPLRGLVRYFTLFEFAASRPVPAWKHVCQRHQRFLVRRRLVRAWSRTSRLSRRGGLRRGEYLHGNLVRGTFTFYGGHTRGLPHASAIRPRVWNCTSTRPLPVDPQQRLFPAVEEVA